MTQATDNYMNASKSLLSECIHDIEATDPEAFRGIAHAMQNGAYCEIRTCFSIIGNNEVLINLIQGDGQHLNLGHIAFDLAPTIQ